jgi:hypothetical protein
MTAMLAKNSKLMVIYFITGLVVGAILATLFLTRFGAWPSPGQSGESKKIVTGYCKTVTLPSGLKRGECVN